MDSSQAPVDSTWATRRRFFPAVEGMRGLAALLVLFGHLLVLSYPRADVLDNPGYWLARFGVTVFFTISGFLLYRPFLAARRSGLTVAAATPPYLWRRAVRILPAYWVALTLLAATVGAVGVFTSHWRVYYGLLQVYSQADLVSGIPVAWTLCVEVTFYLALPLVAAFLARRGVGSRSTHPLAWEFGVLGGLAALTLLWRAEMVGSADTASLSLTLFGTFAWFAAGMVLAAMQVAHPAALSRARALLSRPELCWPAGALVFATLPLGILNHTGLSVQAATMLEVLIMGAAATLLMGPATLGDEGRTVRWALANRTIVFAGAISYGIYLWHFPIELWLLGREFVYSAAHPILLLGSISLAATVAMATASWFLVEKPLMRRARSVKAFADVSERALEIPADVEAEEELAEEAAEAGRAELLPATNVGA